jgi:type II restriction enzyme
MTPAIIQKRKELSRDARRAGWVGSNILLGNLPHNARIPIVEDCTEVPKKEVREMWRRFGFLREQSMRSRGWLSDVLTVVRKLEKETFTLQEVYAFEEELSKLHPMNRHIKPKIRQQLQLLRGHDVIEFLGKGEYRINRL